MNKVSRILRERHATEKQIETLTGNMPDLPSHIVGGMSALQLHANDEGTCLVSIRGKGDDFIAHEDAAMMGRFLTDTFGEPGTSQPESAAIYRRACELASNALAVYGHGKTASGICDALIAQAKKQASPDDPKADTQETDDGQLDLAEVFRRALETACKNMEQAGHGKASVFYDEFISHHVTSASTDWPPYTDPAKREPRE